MRYRLQAVIKNTSMCLPITQVLSRALWMALIVGSLTQANAELIIHSEPTQQQVVTSEQTEAFNSDVFKMWVVNRSHNMTAPTDASVIKLMQVMHIDEQIKSIVKGQKATIEAIHEQAQNRKHLPENKASSTRQRELQEQIQNVLGQYSKIMTESIGEAANEQTLTQAYVNAAKTYYTQAEVDAQIGFYDTVIGQSILAKQPQITADFLKQSLPDDTSEAEGQLEALLPQMKQIIKGIF
ncbi:MULTISPECIES: DUF2059 domain-containing protein [Psychrobacter]|uniref:DUF2059 domain-containing protein n=1 Tax=Psychrobacter TaxID=497 RepID=UPI000EE65183|nr:MULTISPECIES: DUF2059 domain-containing protein [Psychrobacter]HCN18222.1 DUF2059 domain-containing protein [Psychrobacter sp.]